MVVAYLAFNAALYAVLGLWCALAPDGTAAFLGFTLVGPPGTSEYLAVYGGLQLGFAAWFGLAAAAPRHRPSALVFAALVYGGIVALRTTAVARFGFTALGNARFAYGLELVLLVAALGLLRRRR
jgi:hypothetical protein